MKILKYILFITLIAFLAVIGYVKMQYGGGYYYPDLTSSSTTTKAEPVITLEFPPGMVAAGDDNRLFFSYHPLHKPERESRSVIFEWVRGKSGEQGVAQPFPDPSLQSKFYGAMGISVDQQARLWAVIPGGPNQSQTKLLAVDTHSGSIVFEYTFPENLALFAQDLRISSDGNTIYLADTGLFNFIPASIVVFDIATKTFRELLKGHASVSPQNILMRNKDGSDYQLVYGLLSFQVGIDGIALSQDDQWLYFASMSHNTAYRIATQYLQDVSLTDQDIAEHLQVLGEKPLTDGIEVDKQNNLIMTEVEHGSLMQLSPQGELTTLAKNDEIYWSDSVTVAENGDIFFTDSRLTQLLDTFAQASDISVIKNQGPYFIYRIQR